MYELPPNGQGMAVLEMLNMMERFPLANHPPLSADAFHIKMEAQKLAYADLHRYLGDPRFGAVPVDGLISKKYAAERAEAIQMERAGCSPKAGNPLSSTGDTIYLTVVDRGRQHRVADPEHLSRVWLGRRRGRFRFPSPQSRRVCSRSRPGIRTSSKPGKRPFHTIIPGLHGEGQPARGLRHHGRIEPGAGARAVRELRGGSRA